MEKIFIAQGNAHQVAGFKNGEEPFAVPTKFMKGMITMRT